MDSKKKIFIGGAIVLAILVIGFFVEGQRTKISIKGININIDQGGMHLEGLMEPEAEYEVLLKDKGIAINTFAGDAFVSIMPYNQAEALRAKYGDFFRCDSPGVQESIQNLGFIIFVSDDRLSKHNIKEAMNLVKKYKIPHISFKGSRVFVNRETYFGIESNRDEGPIIFYVKSFNIKNRSYF